MLWTLKGLGKSSLVGINKFLSHIIKKVPASIGKGALKESQCDEADVGFLEILKCVLWLQPEVFACGHKGQEAAQRAGSEAQESLACLVLFLPLSEGIMQLSVLFPITPQTGEVGPKEAGKFGARSSQDLVTLRPKGVSGKKHSSECSPFKR